MMVLLIIGLAVVLAIELPGLRKLHSLRDTVTFFVLLLLGFILFALILFNIEIPSPIKGIWYLIDKVLKISYPTM